MADIERDELERRLRLQARALVLAVGALVDIDITRAAGHPGSTQADLAHNMRTIAKTALADLREMGI